MINKSHPIYPIYMCFAYISLFVLGISDNIRGPIFSDLIHEFNISQSLASLFFSLSSIANIIGGYSSTYLIRKIGSMNSLRMAHIMLSVSYFMVCAAKSYFFILVAMFFYGISIGILGVVQGVMVVTASSETSVQKWASGLQSMYGLASLGAPLLVSWLFKIQPSWKFPFLVLASIGLLLTGISFLWSESIKDYNEESTEDVPAGKIEMYFFASIFAAYVGLELLISTHLVQYTREIFHWSVDAANSLLALFFAGMFLGRFIFVFWKPNLKLYTQMKLSLIVAILCSIFGFFINPYFLALTGICVAPFYPLCMTVASRLYARELSQISGYATGLMGISVVVMQTLAGKITDIYNHQVGMLVGPVFGILTLILMFLYEKYFRKLP